MNRPNEESCGAEYLTKLETALTNKNVATREELRKACQGVSQFLEHGFSVRDTENDPFQRERDHFGVMWDDLLAQPE